MLWTRWIRLQVEGKVKRPRRDTPGGDAFPVTERHQRAWHPEGAGEPFALELDRLFRSL